MSAKIRVLIVDDSAVIRKMFSHILSSDPEIEVVATAIDPYMAREKLISLKPDVMTLDIEMPRMDGVSFLEAVMKHFPVRTLVISSLSTRNSELGLRALEVGAVDVLTKPAIDVATKLEEARLELIARVKAASRAQLPAPGRIRSSASAAVRPASAGRSESLSKTTHQVVAIASSTGGTEALKEVLPRLPADVPGILIVQHMPPVFTKAFAESLSRMCPFEVREAVDGERVLPGLALLAPGNFHMELSRSGAFYYVKLHQQSPLHGVRPAADYLMNSVARYAGGNAIGLILTGMGKDGARGLLEMKRAGAHTIAQDEASCIVFGMPREAIELGAVNSVLSLNAIPGELLNQFKRRAVA